MIDWEAIFMARASHGVAQEILHTSIRAVIVYLSVLGMVRIGSARFRGQNAPLDFVAGIIIGSAAAAAIEGLAPAIATLAGILTLVALHWVLSALAFRYRWFSALAKGESDVLVEQGSIQWDAMRRNHISENDLKEELRSHGLEDFSEVKEARIERGGMISVVPFDKDRSPGVTTPR